jgi:hypothetical protein
MEAPLPSPRLSPFSIDEQDLGSYDCEALMTEYTQGAIFP